MDNSQTLVGQSYCMAGTAASLQEKQEVNNNYCPIFRIFVSNICFIETGFQASFFFSRAQMSRFSLGDHHLVKVLVSDETKFQLSLLSVCYGES